MTLYVLRHGETAWSRQRRHTGRSDIPLTEEGRAQARAIGPFLSALRESAPFSLVLSSPLVRAAETAVLAGVTAALDPRLMEPAALDPRLMEWDYGDYDGVTSDAIRAERPDWDLWRDGCPGGETPEQVRRRVDALLAERVIPALGGDRDVLLVAHSHLLRALAARWLNLPIDGGRLLVLGPAGVGVLGDEHGGPAVLGWNLQPVP
jgi:probable phosphoglycerate mutase